MTRKNKIEQKALSASDSARDEFQAFEIAFRLLRADDLKYLREQSVFYKKAVRAVQELILPIVSAGEAISGKRSRTPICLANNG